MDRQSQSVSEAFGNERAEGVAPPHDLVRVCLRHLAHLVARQLGADGERVLENEAVNAAPLRPRDRIRG